MAQAQHHRGRRRPPGWWHRFSHSLRARLMALFALLALATTLVFVAGTGQVFSNGWRELARPLISDYVSRLAAEIGSPPDIAKAQALVQRLPITIAISGPVVQWRSAPLPERAAPDRHPHDPAARAMLTRRTADGHELRFGLRNLQWDDAAPNRAGWITLGGLLGLTALAFALVRRLLKPLDDIRAGTQRYEAGDFSQPIPERRRDELGDLAGRVNDMASGLKRMLDGQRGLLLAEIGAGDVRQIIVFNKLDRVDPPPRHVQDWVQRPGGQWVPRVFVSARDGSGLAELRTLIAQAASPEGWGEALIPPTPGPDATGEVGGTASPADAEPTQAADGTQLPSPVR